LKVPVIVIARKGEEQKVIQAFRLGATDFLLWPVREAEVVAAVERAVQQVRESRTRQRLDEQLTDTHEELQQRVRELTTIFAVGKAVISITDHRILLDQIVEGMLYAPRLITAGCCCASNKSGFLLAAHRNLPEGWANKLGQQLDDGISSLVALSGETLAINGEPLKRFRVASLGQSALVVPVKVHKEVIGLLVLVRSENKPFDKNMQSLLEAVTEYAAVSLVNARLIRAIQQLRTQPASGRRKSARNSRT
jgi:transcriptional regulator with GAF, ATPase, and Fis domain